MISPCPLGRATCAICTLAGHLFSAVGPPSGRRRGCGVAEAWLRGGRGVAAGAAEAWLRGGRGGAAGWPGRGCGGGRGVAAGWPRRGRGGGARVRPRGGGGARPRGRRARKKSRLIAGDCHESPPWFRHL